MAPRIHPAAIVHSPHRAGGRLARNLLIVALTVMGTPVLVGPASARVEAVAQPQREAKPTLTKPTIRTPAARIRATHRRSAPMRISSGTTPRLSKSGARKAKAVSNAVPVSKIAGTVATMARPARPTPQTLQAYITGYSYFDNTPPGSPAISHPVIHQTAAGVGTFTDPITVAVGHSIINGNDRLDWPAGSKFYVPNLRRYFIVEDTCGDGSTPQNGPCHTGYPAGTTTWLDIWVDGRNGTVDSSNACMDAITGVWTAVKNPASNYAVVSGSVVGANGCSAQYGNNPTFG